eukprot:2347008-Rhodomonas_salina.1
MQAPPTRYHPTHSHVLPTYITLRASYTLSSTSYQNHLAPSYQNRPSLLRIPYAMSACAESAVTEMHVAIAREDEDHIQ